MAETVTDGTTFPLRAWELIWYTIILLTGTFGNLLVCLVIYKSSSVFRSTPFNMYLCSLAIADTLLALVVLPNYMLSTSIFHHPTGVMGDVMCKTITGDFLTFYFSTVSEYSLMLISLERLHTVRKFPMTLSVHSRSQRRRAWLSIAAAWFVPFTFEGPKAIYFLEYKRAHSPVIGNYCTFIWAGEPTLCAQIYASILLIAESFIPLVIFIFSFYNIRKCLVKEEKRLTERMGGGDSFNQGYKYFSCFQIFERRRKTVKTLMIVTTVFVICWIPDKIMFFIMTYMGDKHTRFTWNSPEYQAGILVRFTGSCINPFLYALRSKEFRKHSEKALKRLIPRCLNDDSEYKQIQNERQKSLKHNQNNFVQQKVITEPDREKRIDSTAADPHSDRESNRLDTRTPSVNSAMENQHHIHRIKYISHCPETP